MRKLRLINRRGLSPIFATIMLATIVIIFGTIVYYYVNNLTTQATNNYASEVASTQQQISERISFENVVYDSTAGTLNIYIINSGSSNNVKISAMILFSSGYSTSVYSSTDNPQTISPLRPIGDLAPTPSPYPQGLNAGNEAEFTVTLGAQTISKGDTFYLITQSGSRFSYGPF